MAPIVGSRPVALTDLIDSDPYKALSPLLRSGEYLGTGLVFNTKCHHLAFRQEFVDWQIWIDQGEKPLPRKLVITYKESPARLQYVAYFDKWDTTAKFGNGTFTFTPAAGAKKIEAIESTTKPSTSTNP